MRIIKILSLFHVSHVNILSSLRGENHALPSLVSRCEKSSTSSIVFGVLRLKIVHLHFNFPPISSVKFILHYMYVEESQYRQCSFMSQWRGSRTGEDDDDDRSEIRLQVLLLLDLFCCFSIIRLHFAITISQERSHEFKLLVLKSTEDPLFEQKQM